MRFGRSDWSMVEPIKSKLKITGSSMSDESHFDIYNIQKILRQWDMPKISLDFYLEGKAFYFIFLRILQGSIK